MAEQLIMTDLEIVLLLTPAVYPPAWVGRSVASVYLFVCALNGKLLELSAPKSVHILSMVGPRQALTLRSKGQMITLT